MRKQSVPQVLHPIYIKPQTGRYPYYAWQGRAVSFNSQWHTEMEILYLMPHSEPLDFYIEEVCHHLQPRDLLLLDSTIVHRADDLGLNNHVVVMQIGYPLLGENFCFFTERRFIRNHYSLASEEDAFLVGLEKLIHQLAQENLLGDPVGMDTSSLEAAAGRLRVSALLFQIAAYLTEQDIFNDMDFNTLRRNQPLQAVQRVINYVEANYSHSITTAQAAALAGYESTRFAQLFKQLTGRTFHRYLTGLRMDAGVRLLIETNLSIASIAEMVGIPQVKTFSRLIRETYGMSTRDIRRQEGKDG